MRLIKVAASLATFFILGAWGAAHAMAGASVDNPRLELNPCVVAGVTGGALCGVYRVPEDRAKPHGRVLPLKVIVLPSRSQGPIREPVFYFEGGPGQPATESAAYVSKLWIRNNNPVVLVDARGTGTGHRLDCILPGSDTDVQGYLQPWYAAGRACGPLLSRSFDLTQYVTPVAVTDVDDVRKALGYKKINLYGASYGSRSAIVYAKMFGGHVRSMYLSGVAPLELKMPLYFAWSAQRALNALIAECIKSEDCRSTYPDPAADLQATLVRVWMPPVLQGDFRTFWRRGAYIARVSGLFAWLYPATITMSA